MGRADRISSGNRDLDSILGGGFPRNSINLIMGLPGAGKSVLGQHIMYANASPELRALFFSTATEPLDKAMRFVQEFSFFDIDKVGEAVIYADLGDVLRSKGLGAAIEAIIAAIGEHAPAYLVIDSFKAMRPFAESDRDFRTQLAMFTTLLSSLPITTFLVGAYTVEELAMLPEFAMSDGIVELGLRRHGVRDTRYVRVSKLRGSEFSGGEHALRIGRDGLDIFKRLDTPLLPPDFEPTSQKGSIGVRILDEMFTDGYWADSSTIVFGPPGAGKTLLGLHFIFRGIESGEKGVIATIQESPPQLERTVRSLGWDLKEALASGMLELIYAPPVDLIVDQFMNDTLNLVRRSGARRVLIDSVSGLQTESSDPARFCECQYALLQHLLLQRVSSFLTHTHGSLFGPSRLPETGVFEMTDNVLVLTYEQRDSRIRRTISMVKSRANAHDSVIREFTISDRGIELGLPLDDVHPGVALAGADDPA
jgi:circadian clock protein KaiC